MAWQRSGIRSDGGVLGRSKARRIQNNILRRLGEEFPRASVLSQMGLHTGGRTHISNGRRPADRLVDEGYRPLSRNLSLICTRMYTQTPYSVLFVRNGSIQTR